MRTYINISHGMTSGWCLSIAIRMLIGNYTFNMSETIILLIIAINMLIVGILYCFQSSELNY